MTHPICIILDISVYLKPITEASDLLLLFWQIKHWYFPW